MGIKELWTILNPYCVRKPLFELQGKVVAIDLAGWICESLCVVDYEVQARFYLRNLFFRTSYLLLSGVTPVFVLEGTAPALKHAMISKRNEIQFRGAAPRKNVAATTDANNPKKPSNKGRTRFNYILKQCEELIRSMGLQCVQGPGEAEAFCAHLNAAKLVDGVISQDSDCFAYGARRVYRNFSMSMQGTASSIGGSIDVYDLDIVNESMDLGRNKIIVMALLCGCDYCPEGVGGVGRDAVQKLFTMYAERDILERVKSWRTNNDKYTSLELKVDDKMICVNCGHNGRVQNHAKSGCGQCKSSTGCDASRWKEQRLSIKAELQIRKKAMIDADFPSQEIIDEFFQSPIEMTHLKLDWNQPNVVKFLKMMSSLLQWEEIYCFQKFLPLLTRWQLFHFGSCSQNLPLRGNVWPDFIKKKRAPKGVASYEIIWKDEQKCFDGLIPTTQIETYLSLKGCANDEEALQSLWSTIEPIDLVEKAYPDLVEKYLQSKIKPKKTKANARKPAKRTKKIADSSLHDMSSLQQALDQIDVAPTKPSAKDAKKTTRKSPKVKKAKVTLQTLEKFFQKNSNKVNAKQTTPTTVDLAEATPSDLPKLPTKTIDLSNFSIDLDDAGSVDCDLSQIIGDIVSKPPTITEIGGKKLRFDEMRIERNSSPSPPSHTDNDYDIDADFDVNVENIEAKEHKGGEEESFDEFDLIVMGKGRKGLVNKPLIENNAPMKSSTPVLIDRFKKKHSFHGRVRSPKADTAEVITTSFFAVAAEDGVDLFERSIDYKNMEDEDLLANDAFDKESLSSESGDDDEVELATSPNQTETK